MKKISLVITILIICCFSGCNSKKEIENKEILNNKVMAEPEKNSLEEIKDENKEERASKNVIQESPNLKGETIKLKPEILKYALSDYYADEKEAFKDGIITDKPIIEMDDINYKYLLNIQDDFGYNEASHGGNIIELNASSTLKDNKYNYSVENLSSFSKNNSWIEGKEDYGIGEKLQYKVFTISAGWAASMMNLGNNIEEKCYNQSQYFEKDGSKENWIYNGIGYKYNELYFALNEIYVVNGYASTDELWQANSRVKKMKLTLNDGTTYILELGDTVKPQIFEIGYKTEGIEEPIIATFEILEVYEGSKYKDTALSTLVLDIGSNIPQGI